MSNIDLRNRDDSIKNIKYTGKYGNTFYTDADVKIVKYRPSAKTTSNDTIVWKKPLNITIEVNEGVRGIYYRLVGESTYQYTETTTVMSGVFYGDSIEWYATLKSDMLRTFTGSSDDFAAKKIWKNPPTSDGSRITAGPLKSDYSVSPRTTTYARFEITESYDAVKLGRLYSVYESTGDIVDNKIYPGDHFLMYVLAEKPSVPFNLSSYPNVMIGDYNTINDPIMKYFTANANYDDWRDPVDGSYSQEESSGIPCYYLYVGYYDNISDFDGGTIEMRVTRTTLNLNYYEFTTIESGQTQETGTTTSITNPLRKVSSRLKYYPNNAIQIYGAGCLESDSNNKSFDGTLIGNLNTGSFSLKYAGISGSAQIYSDGYGKSCRSSDYKITLKVVAHAGAYDWYLRIWGVRYREMP